MAKRLTRTFEIREPEGNRTINTYGQVARTLVALLDAGDKGITSLDISSWALRTSSYISDLRHRHGLDIQTNDENHENPDGFVGTHARYILKSKVAEILDDQEVAA